MCGGERCLTSQGMQDGPSVQGVTPPAWPTVRSSGGTDLTPCSWEFKGDLRLSLRELIICRRQKTCSGPDEGLVGAGSPGLGDRMEAGAPVALGRDVPSGLLISHAVSPPHP